jgi:hypothetical protein
MLYVSHPPRDNRVGDPNGIRTRVTAVKGRCPGPLDDRVVQGERNMAVRKGCASEKWAGPLRGAPERQARTPRSRFANSAIPELLALGS